MPRDKDFQKIHSRFVQQHGKEKGENLYYSWLNKKGFSEEKSFPRKKEGKEKLCSVVGFELKEDELSYHLEGLIASSHIDKISDKIPKETLESFAEQMNSSHEARIMGVHHSEGKKDREHFGEADIENNLVKVIPLNDGEWGLWADTKLFKDDPKTPEIINSFETGDLNSFSITYETDDFRTTDFEMVGDEVVRVLLPETRLYGYTAANNPVNPNAIATGFGFKEFKELVKMETHTVEKEVEEMVEKKEEVKTGEVNQTTTPDVTPKKEVTNDTSGQPSEVTTAEQKEFEMFKANKTALEQKEFMEKTAEKIAEKLLSNIEVKEKVLKEGSSPSEIKEVSFEIKEFTEAVMNPKKLELKEQFRRAAAFGDLNKIEWNSVTKSVESREYKNFGVNGTKLEYKGLGITTNQNTDTNYLQSTAELQDVYDPIIYNGLNQETVTWNLLAKDNYSSKGNNKVQFTLKTAANTSRGFYTGNAVATGNVSRLKYETKFKKAQVGVSVDGDMIAAARGGPLSDVFAQEVMDSTMDLMEILNVALFAEVGLETAAGVIGFEYITDSAGNTSLYNLTRSTANRLAPDSATDTYINQSSTVISMANLRAAKRNALNEGAKKSRLVFITNPVQADVLRGKFDAARRMLTDKDTGFGFSTDLFVDGIPIFEDTDCNTDDWFLIDLETHRIGMWIPPTIERLGKLADSEDAFIKTYFATYNRAPRRMVQIYGCATS